MDRGCFENYIFYETDLLSVSYSNEIFTLDRRRADGNDTMKVKKIVLTITLYNCKSYVRWYLVEITDGSLVLVDRYYHVDIDTLNTCKVYKLIYLNSNDDDNDNKQIYHSIGGDCLGGTVKLTV